MKLSLQTVDYRLAKLEEIALQTAESLHQLQQIIVSSDLIQRQFSSEDAESTDGDNLSQQDSLSPPSVLFGAQSAPSKLAHKKHRMNEDRLRPFTDYSQSSSRKPFARSMTVAAQGSGQEVALMPSNHKMLRQQTMFTRQASVASPPAEIKPKPTPTNKTKGKSYKGSGPYLGSELYYRRRSKALSRLRTTGLSSKALKEEEEPKQRDGRVTFSDGSSMDESPQRKAFSLDAVDSLITTSQSSNSQTPDCGDSTPSVTSPTYTQASSHSRTDITTRHVTRQMSSPTPSKLPARRRINVPPSSLPSQMVTSRPAMPRNVVPITPIVTPNRSEYTTITDEIDTAGVKYSSPTGSPQSPRRIFFGVEVNVDLYTKKSKPQNDAISEEAEQLKHAEESEHAEMELMIRKRMRQISLTESDSMGDIAMHIVQELEGKIEKEEEPGYHSDEGEAARKEELPVVTLVKVNSEPLLTQLKETSSVSSVDKLSAPLNAEEERSSRSRRRPPLHRSRTVSDTPPDAETNWSAPAAFVWPGSSSSSRPKLTKMETQC